MSKKWLLVSGLVLFVLVAIHAITVHDSTRVETKFTEEEVNQVFDIPPLVGKNLDELIAILGTPDEDSEPPATYVKLSDDRTWDKAWYREGYSLSVSYNIDTGKVVDLFLGSNSDHSLTVFRDTNNILTVGNLSSTSTDYSVEFVKIKAALGKPLSETPEGYTGAIIRGSR